MYPISYYAATAQTLPVQAPLGAQSRRCRRMHRRRRITPDCQLHCISRRPARASSCSRPNASVGARPGATADSSLAASARTSTGSKRTTGPAQARQLWDLGEAAKGLVKQLIAELAIDCDLTPGVAIVAHKSALRCANTTRSSTNSRLSMVVRSLQKLDARETRELLGTDAYYGGYVDWDAAHLHPLNLALGVARRCLELGVRIYESTRAIDFADSATCHGANARRRVASTPTHLVLAANGIHREPRADARRTHHADQQLHHRDANRSMKPLAQRDQSAAHRGRRLAFRHQLFPHDAGPPAAVRRRRELSSRLSARHRARSCRPYMLKIYPQLAHTPIDYAWGGTLAITRTGCRISAA